MLLILAGEPLYLTVYKIVSLVAIPFVFVLTTVAVYLVRKHTRNKKAWRYTDKENGNIICGEPLMPPQNRTIKDLIEHTTSGSGSGINMFPIIELLPNFRTHMLTSF